MPRVARGPGGADAQALDRAVHPLEQQVQPARALPGFLHAAQTVPVSRAITAAKASAVSSGSTKPSRAWTSSGGKTGTIGSNTVPSAWSSRVATSGPKRRVSGARGVAASCATRLEAEQAQAVGDAGGQAQGLDRQGGEGGCRVANRHQENRTPLPLWEGGGGRGAAIR